MSEYQTKQLTAALLYQDHDPLNFKHLATTLNLILEPAKLKFRVVHERPGLAAVLSCRKLHVAITTNEAALASDDLQRTLGNWTSPDLTEKLQSKIAGHRRTIEISIGSGPLPHGAAHEDPASLTLLPLLGHMVVNHLLNMNPADAIYWGPTDQMMSPRAFLAMINASAMEDAQEPSDHGGTRSAAPTPSAALASPTPNMLRRDIIKEREEAASSLSPNPSRLRPSFIAAHLGADTDAPSFELSDHIRQRFSIAMEGPKAPFVVSVATILVAPIVGILLLIYNFMGGARLRQTALFACLAAAVTLAADLVADDGDNATAAAPVTPVGTVQL